MDYLYQRLLNYLRDMTERGDHTAENLLKDLEEVNAYLDADIEDWSDV